MSAVVHGRLHALPGSVSCCAHLDLLTPGEALVALVPEFDVASSEVPEEATGDPTEDAVRLATDKARAVAARHPDTVTIGADTIVHDGSTRNYWVADTLRQILEEPQPNAHTPPETFLRVIRTLMDQSDALNEPTDRTGLIGLQRTRGKDLFFIKKRQCRCGCWRRQ